MSLASRIGLAVVRPRAALALAGDRRHAGRSGSDLLAAFAILLIATQLRWLVSAVWLGAVVDAALGLRALVHVLTRTLTVDLGLLVIGAGGVWLAGGPRRELGRSFDLACVAALPLVLVHLVAQTAIDAFALALPGATSWVVESLAYGWMAGLLTLAVFTNRRPDRPPSDVHAGRGAGWGLATVAAAGLTLQLVWLGQHVDQVRPLVAGAPAPPLSLSAIGANGSLGQRISIPPGKVVILDFWATWCGPCLKAMPNLDAIARRHPEVAVVTINLDDPGEARKIFDEAHYALTLVADDGVTSERYGVTTIPHTVVIDRGGTLRQVVHGGRIDLEAAIDALGR